jgi:hypothetical protein
MSGSSKLFEEFVVRRCEEITQADEESQKLNSKILQLEADFKKTLNADQLKKYHELEEAIIESATHSEICTYKQALNDKI